MENWLIFALLSALCWGSYIVLSKIVISKNYFGLVYTASLLMLVGISIIFLGFFLTKKPTIPANSSLIFLGLFAGAIWVLAQFW